MSRTNRNVEWAHWYRNPSTINQRIIKDKYVNEVKEEYGVYYLRPRDLNCSELPQVWDDRRCSGYVQKWTEEKKVNIILKPFITWVGVHNLFYKTQWFVEINFNKNIVFVSNYNFGIMFKEDVSYLPFIIKTKKARYKIKINQSKWK